MNAHQTLRSSGHPVGIGGKSRSRSSSRTRISADVVEREPRRRLHYGHTVVAAPRCRRFSVTQQDTDLVSVLNHLPQAPRTASTLPCLTNGRGGVRGPPNSCRSSRTTSPVTPRLTPTHFPPPGAQGWPDVSTGVSQDVQRSATGRGSPDLRFHDLHHTGAVLAAATVATLPELIHRLGHTTAGAAM
jgi:hypothetical protein